MAGLWDQVHALDGTVPADVQRELLLDGRKLVERATRWLLRHGGSPLDMPATVDRLAAGVAEVGSVLTLVLSSQAERENRKHAATLTEEDVPAGLAERVAAFDELFSALDIVEVARAGGHPVAEVTATYFAVEERLKMRWLRDRINELPRDNRWQTLARVALRDDLYGQLREVTAAVLAVGDLDTWLKSKAAVIARSKQVLADIRATGTFDLATLSVALRETDALVD
jgi:glutamate dehydrogenase